MLFWTDIMASQREAPYSVTIKMGRGNAHEIYTFETREDPRNLDLNRHLDFFYSENVRALLKEELPKTLKVMHIGEKKSFTSSEPVSWNDMKPLP